MGARNENDASSPRTALLLLGGGARAAYQVGFLRCLARRMPKLRFEILVGVSSGAINVAHLASRRCPFPEATAQLAELWGRLTPASVMEVGSFSLARNALLWAARLLSGGHRILPEARGLVDCRPLQRLLCRHLEGPDRRIRGIEENLRDGGLEAVALSATRYATGESVTFVQGRSLPPSWNRSRRVGISARLGVKHVMASASLPLVFPAVRLDESWYGDGGIRQSTPLAPAIGLGADRIVAVSTHHLGGPPASGDTPPAVEGYPPPAQVVGSLFNSVFLDRLDDDLRRLERINRLLSCAPDGRRGDLRKIDAFVLRPSVDLGRLARAYEDRLPKAFRFMTRGLGTRETASPDFLSMVLFEPAYLQKLIELGEADAVARSDELAAFLASEARPRS